MGLCSHGFRVPGSEKRKAHPGGGETEARAGKGRDLPRSRSGAGIRRFISQPFAKDSFMRKGPNNPQHLLGGLSGLNCINYGGFINAKDITSQLS